MASDAEVDLVVNATRALSDVERDLDRLVRQAENEADPIRLRSTLDRIASQRAVQNDLRRVISDAEARLRARPLNIPVRVDIDENRVRRADQRLATLRRGALGAVSGVAALSGGVLALGTSVGSVLPLVAGLVTATESLAPAAAVAATGLVAVQLASGAVKLAMIGVEDAIKSAFDPDAKPEDLAKQMERLAPNARAFVRELVKMRSQFRGLQQAVQGQFFENFDAVARQLGRTVLPQLSTALRQTSGSLNEMVRRAAAAGVALSESGVLGQALSGATRSIQNLRDVPAQAVTGFGALAAAAAPALDRITQRVAALAERISNDLVDSFRSGGLTAAIDEAVANFAQLGRSAGNVLGGLRNIFSGLSADSGTLFGNLERVTGAFQDITGSRAFQGILRELSATAQTLGRNLVGILKPALEGVGTLFDSLAPSVRDVLDQIGPKLAGAMRDLKPLFDGVGEAVGGFLEAASPLVELAIELIGLIGGALGPIFRTLGDIFRSMAPVLRQIADNFLAIARPILEQLGPAFDKVFPLISEAAERIFPKVAAVLARLEPGFTKLGEAVAKLIPVLAEINAIIVDKLIRAFEKLAPVFAPITDDILELIGSGLEQLAFVLENFVVPALEAFVDFLNGDTRTAGLKFIELSRKIDEFVTAAFNSLKDHVISALNTLAGRIVGIINGALIQATAAVNRKLAEIVQFFRSLPGRITSALGNLGNLLFSQGSSLIGGFIDGVQSQVGRLESFLNGITSRLPDWKGPLERDATILGPNGKALIEGFQAGIAAQIPELRKQLQGLTMALPSMATPAPLAGGVLAAPAPIVNVFLGNERLNGFVDSRIQSNNRDRDRRIAQGGGRR